MTIESVETRTYLCMHRYTPDRYQWLANGAKNILVSGVKTVSQNVVSLPANEQTLVGIGIGIGEAA